MAVMKFLFLQYENRTQGISFYINSPGGSVYSTLAIYDTMQFIECPIATYCIGMAASGARSCWPAGTKGRRFALPHSKIMIHQPYGQVGGQISDIEIQAKEIMDNKHDINEILAKHTGQPYDQVAKRHRARPLPDGDPGQGIRPGRRGRRPHPAAEVKDVPTA